MRTTWAKLLSLMVVGVLGAAACGDDGGGSGTATKGSTNVTIVTTTTVLSDFATIVSGGRAGVTGLLKAGVDPHDFEPTPRDINTMKSASVIVRNGLDLDPWVDDAVKSSGTKAPLIDASEGAKLRSEDPHLWHDPRNAKVMVANIAKGLSAADPAGKATYEANAAKFSAELDALDAEIAGQIGTLTNKKVVTNHDAFGYYLDRYGLEFVGSVIPSFETSAEVSAADLDKLVKDIKSQGVKAVFTESALPSKVAQTIAKDAGVKVVAGDDALFGDGLGPAKSAGGTYVKMMRHNTKTIVDNLK